MLPNDSEQRRRLAKEIAYCETYGGTSPVRAGLTPDEAQRLVKEWGDRYSVLRDNLQRLKANAPAITKIVGNINFQPQLQTLEERLREALRRRLAAQ